MLKSLTLAIVSLLFVSTSAHSQSDQFRRSVSVSGQCNRSVIPDRGSIQLVAEHQDPNLKVAIKRANEIYEKVRDGVKKLGLKDLELTTSESTLTPVQEWVKDRNVMRGYRSRLGLNVRTSEISRLGEVIELAAKHDVKNIDGLVTTLSPELLQKEQESCLEEATKNAKLRAEKLASAAGAKLGQALTLSESWGARPMPMDYMARGKNMMSAESAVAPPQVEAGREQLSVTVQATFELR